MYLSIIISLSDNNIMQKNVFIQWLSTFHMWVKSLAICDDLRDRAFFCSKLELPVLSFLTLKAKNWFFPLKNRQSISTWSVNRYWVWRAYNMKRFLSYYNIQSCQKMRIMLDSYSDKLVTILSIHGFTTKILSIFRSTCLSV